MLKLLSLGRSKNEPVRLDTIPAGTFIKTEKGYFYVHSNTSRYRFISTRVLDSWKPLRVASFSESDPAVKRLRVAAKIGFRNGSLIWNLADGKIYLIEALKRRWIKSPDVLAALGAKDSDVMAVSSEEIELHEIGEDLTK